MKVYRRAPKAELESEPEKEPEKEPKADDAPPQTDVPPVVNHPIYRKLW